jgi:hypothetical protein
MRQGAAAGVPGCLRLAGRRGLSPASARARVATPGSRPPQHHSIDVFEPIAALFPVGDIATLDDLATGLFDV